MTKGEMLAEIERRGYIWLMRRNRLLDYFHNSNATQGRKWRAWILAIVLNARIGVLVNRTIAIQSLNNKLEQGGIPISPNWK